MDGCIGCKSVKQNNGHSHFSHEVPRQSLRHIEFNNFTLTEYLHAPGSVLPPHVHDACSICVTLAGGGVETHDNLKDETRPGTVIIRPGGESHANRYGPEGSRGFMIEVGPRLMLDLELARVFARPTVMREGLIPTLAMRMYQESKINDSAAQIVIEGLFLELLGNAARLNTPPSLRQPPWLRLARDLCHAHFNDSVNLFQIAAAVGVHPTHLARSFRRHYRSTVGDYIRRLRLDWATRRLTETDETIATIANAAGFYDQSHFTHSFKQQLGVSPAEFRAALTRPGP